MKKENSIYSRTFLKRNRETLVRIGIPVAITENERMWGYFIEHLDYPGIPFRLEDLSLESLIALHTLLCPSIELGTEGMKHQLEKLIHSRK